jgi:hypothetical protein
VAFDESDSDHAKDSDSVTKSNLVHHGKYYMDSVRYYMTKTDDQDTMGKLFKANFYEVFNAATGINGYKPQNPREIETKALRFPRIDSQSEPVFTNKGNPQPQNQNSQNTIGNSSGINKSISIFLTQTTIEKRVIVFDLDETLIHSVLCKKDHPDALEIAIEGTKTYVKILPIKKI